MEKRTVEKSLKVDIRVDIHISALRVPEQNLLKVLLSSSSITTSGIVTTLEIRRLRADGSGAGQG